MEQFLKSNLRAFENSQHMLTARMRARVFLRRLGAAARQWWAGWWIDDRIAYLSHAEDPVDLEYRIRRWNDHDRRGRMPIL